MNITIEKTKSISPPVTMTLEMGAEEALALQTVLRYIGGHLNGPRGVTDAISHALSEAGVGYYENAMSGDLYFRARHDNWNHLEIAE